MGGGSCTINRTLGFIIRIVCFALKSFPNQLLNQLSIIALRKIRT
jgi:hypothetical protein